MDVSAVAYYGVVDATKSAVAIENVVAAIDRIARTTLCKVVGQHTPRTRLDLAETDRINVKHARDPRHRRRGPGVVVTLVELKDIPLPESMKRAMARQALAERENEHPTLMDGAPGRAAYCETAEPR